MALALLNEENTTMSENMTQNAVIKVIGLGGAGGNAVDYMMQEVIDGVEFLVANTDAQALRKSKTSKIIQSYNSLLIKSNQIIELE